MRFFWLLFMVVPGCYVSPVGGGEARSGGATIRQSDSPASGAMQDRTVSNVVEAWVSSTNLGALGIPWVVEGPVLLRNTHYEVSKQSLGAAHKDSSREIMATLKAMRPVQYVGIVLVLAAIAMIHPVVRAFVGSGTTQVLTGAVGLALIFGPMVLVGNEQLVLLGLVAVVLMYWFGHRHGELRGKQRS